MRLFSPTRCMHLHWSPTGHSYGHEILDVAMMSRSLRMSRTWVHKIVSISYRREVLMIALQVGRTISSKLTVHSLRDRVEGNVFTGGTDFQIVSHQIRRLSIQHFPLYSAKGSNPGTLSPAASLRLCENSLSSLGPTPPLQALSMVSLRPTSGQLSQPIRGLR